MRDYVLFHFLQFLQEIAMRFMTWGRLLSIALLALYPCLLWADSLPDNKVPAEHDIGADHFIAGCPVHIAHPIAGDLMAAGCNVDVLAEVGGSLVAMGANLRISAPVKQDVYAAGGNIYIDAPVQRSLRVAGGKVNLGPNAKIGGNVSVGGGEVDIDGAIAGYLQVGGGTVRINGPIGGDVEIGTGNLELGPNTRIEGRLRYASDHDIILDPAAQVRGGMEKIERIPAAQSRWHAHRGFAHGWPWSIGLMAIAAILCAALPQFYKNVAQTARTRWGFSLLIGFIALVCIPIAAVITAITIIGIPLALAMIALYLVLLLVGHVSAGISLGHIALQRWQAERFAQTGWRVGAAMLGMLTLSLLGRVPHIGGLVMSLAMLTGIGALLMQLRTTRGSAGISVP
jgi:hypothetical protein